MQLVGISINDETSHKKFISRFGLKIKLLCDKEGKISRAYNAMSIIGASKRKLAPIDKDGIVRYVNERFPLFFVGSGKLLKALKAVSKALRHLFSLQFILT